MDGWMVSARMIVVYILFSGSGWCDSNDGVCMSRQHHSFWGPVSPD